MKRKTVVRSRVEQLAIKAGFDISENNLIWCRAAIDEDKIIRKFAELIRAEVLKEVE